MADNLPTTLPPSRNDPSIATSDDESIDLTPAGVRRGRRPKFTAEEDMIIAREVAAAKAHIASFGTKRECFAAAAERACESKPHDENCCYIKEHIMAHRLLRPSTLPAVWSRCRPCECICAGRFKDNLYYDGQNLFGVETFRSTIITRPTRCALHKQFTANHKAIFTMHISAIGITVRVTSIAEISGCVYPKLCAKFQ
jgi:hypothetical protein